MAKVDGRGDNLPFEDMFHGTIFEEGGAAAVPCIRRRIFEKWDALNEDFGRGIAYKSWGNPNKFPLPDSCLGGGVVRY